MSNKKTLVYQIPKNEVNHDTVKLIADDSYNVVHVAQKHKLLQKASSTPLRPYTHKYRPNIGMFANILANFIYNL